MITAYAPIIEKLQRLSCIVYTTTYSRYILKDKVILNPKTLAQVLYTFFARVHFKSLKKLIPLDFFLSYKA